MPAEEEEGVTVRIRFEPRDLWIGLFWDRSALTGNLCLYLCLIPCFPICVTVRTRT